MAARIIRRAGAECVLNFARQLGRDRKVARIEISDSEIHDPDTRLNARSNVGGNLQNSGARQSSYELRERRLKTRLIAKVRNS